MSHRDALVDRAKKVINDRIISMLDGELGGHASTGPLYVGMPISHHEGSWLCEISAKETAEKVAAGIPLGQALQGAFEWTLLVGMAAAQVAAEGER